MNLNSYVAPVTRNLKSNSVNINDICELSGWSPIWTIENMILESVGGLE